MPIFSRSSVMPASVLQLFRFHENPHNLRMISPPSMRILEIDAEQTARPGDRFRLKVRQGPLTLDWTGQWLTVEPPLRLVDTGLKSPFAVWRHEHLFEEQKPGLSRLTDRVEFRLPWIRGGVFGDFFALRVVFPWMFALRHRATRAFFERQSA